MAQDPGTTNLCRVNGRERRKVTFRFFPNGTSTTAMTGAANTLIDPGGFVQDVTRTATAGVFTVTFRQIFYQCCGFRVQAQLSANNVDLVAQVGNLSNLGKDAATSNTTAVVRLMTGATATDMASNTNNSVACEFDFEMLPGGGNPPWT